MAADSGSMIWVGKPLTTPQKRMAGSSKMAADSGSMIWLWKPLTTPQKRMAGSSKMAADSGSMIWVGKPLNQKMAGAEDKKRDRLSLISFFFNNKLDVQGWFGL